MAMGITRDSISRGGNRSMAKVSIMVVQLHVFILVVAHTMVDMKLGDPLADDLDTEMVDGGLELCHLVPELLHLHGFVLEASDMAHD
jgi:hypothetical protein